MVGEQDWKMEDMFGGYGGNPAGNDKGDSDVTSKRITKGPDP